MATNGDSPDTSAGDTSRDPSGFLSEIIGAPVTVKLNSGIVYKVDTTDADQDAVRIALEYCNVTRTHAVVVLGFNLAFVLFFSIGFFYRHQDTVFFSMSAASAIVVIVCNALGDLQSVDGYMNIALERCKEWSDGKLVRSWGDAFVRGNNVTYISADNA